jgi:hypothetical protein
VDTIRSALPRIAACSSVGSPSSRSACTAAASSPASTAYASAGPEASSPTNRAGAGPAATSARSAAASSARLAPAAAAYRPYRSAIETPPLSSAALMPYEQPMSSTVGRGAGCRATSPANHGAASCGMQ